LSPRWTSSRRSNATRLAIFGLLGEAEASVHGEALEEIHFHEVGADDAIADVVGATALLHDLEPERVVTTPLATGGGTVSMSHGEYPVPTPAVVEIAERADWSLRGGPVDAELLTPTGAGDSGPRRRRNRRTARARTPRRRATARAATISIPIRTSSGYWSETGRTRRTRERRYRGPRDESRRRDARSAGEGLQETLADAGARDVSISRDDEEVPSRPPREGHLQARGSGRVARALAEDGDARRRGTRASPPVDRRAGSSRR